MRGILGPACRHPSPQVQEDTWSDRGQHVAPSYPLLAPRLLAVAVILVRAVLLVRVVRRSRVISTVTRGSCPAGTSTLIAFSAEMFASHPIRTRPTAGRRREPTRRSRPGRFRLPLRCRRQRRLPPEPSCRPRLPPELPDATTPRATRTCAGSGPRTCAVPSRSATEALESLEALEDRLPEAQS